MIFDSDVLIWFLRGNENAQQKVLAEAPLKISAVTYMELVQGMKDKRELSILKKTLKNLDAEVLQVEKDISEKAVSFVEEFYLSNSFELGDALIAATCLKYDEPLCTANDKHYKVVEGLKLDIFRQ
ncbi:MAG: type II toxin-antitoxin system VapC family toxin [Treponema sp.]|nr:type II toxin-antitoxin system VapC family toxin [Treponema sp.]MBR0099997.1 type II toxin-antitoxin system VapC family toxin [Treponema sp.]